MAHCVSYRYCNDFIGELLKLIERLNEMNFQWLGVVKSIMEYEDIIGILFLFVTSQTSPLDRPSTKGLRTFASIIIYQNAFSVRAMKIRMRMVLTICCQYIRIER